MQELIAQLLRLYLPIGAGVPDGLERHLDGIATGAFDLVKDGAVRAIVLPFDRPASRNGPDPWERLCEVANALQGELALPAPAVSVSGATGFRLWLSFGEPLPVAAAQQFADLLRAAYCPDIALPSQGVQAPVALPPHRYPSTDKWAAFIHPGMGASFADEPALEVAPPLAAQAAFLQGLQSIGHEQLAHALALLQPVPAQPSLPAQPAGQASQTTAHAGAAAPANGLPQDLLLKDATLEDIVRFLHARNIEPTFRHLLPPR